MKQRERPPTLAAAPNYMLGLERETRVELATLCLGSKCSTNSSQVSRSGHSVGTRTYSWQPKACSGREDFDPGLADHGHLSRTFHQPFAVMQNAASRASDAQKR